MPGISATISVALKEFSLNVDFAVDGGRIALLGANGSGKTTLLKALLGIYRPERGCICLGDSVVFDSSKRINWGPEYRQIGYVPQTYGLFPHMNVWENVAFALGSKASRTKRSEIKQASLDLLKTWGVDELAYRNPGGLSGGERQRVALARALAVQPRWLFLDEPFAALDVRIRGPLRKRLLDYLSRENCNLLFVTHDWGDVLALATHVLVLDFGCTYYFGTIDEVLKNYGANVPQFVTSLIEREQLS